MVGLLPKYIIPAALSILPPKLDTIEARAMLYAIALQETDLKYRTQIVGPAHGLWQFEKNGACWDVMNNSKTRELMKDCLETLLYKRNLDHTDLYNLIVNNDILACDAARLRLLILPVPLPKANEVDLSWGQYLAAWKPGKPHRETWDNYYTRAWNFFREIRV